MKKNILLFALASVSIVFDGCNQQNQKPMKDTVNIGAVLPLTGKAAQYGAYFKQGSELAYSDAVENGIIKKTEVKLIIEDGKGDATASLSAFNKLVDTDKISSCLIDLSSVILAIKPVANKDSIVSINSSSFSSEIEDADDYIFSVLPNAKQYQQFPFYKC